MFKGQVSPQNVSQFLSILILSSIWMLWTSGCSHLTTSQTPEEIIKTEAVTPLQKTNKTDASPRQTSTGTPTPDCLSSGGNIQDAAFYSDTLAMDFFYKVYLPPCYDQEAEQQYPVLYLLHGLSYDNDQWIRLGLKEQMDDLIQRGEISPFIVILPEESQFDPPELSAYGEVLVDELLSDVSVHFQTINKKSHRGIGGLSRGAAWAVRIGFEHHDLFSKVGAHSLPLFKADVSHIPGWLSQIPKKDLPLFFIDIGRDDPEWETAQTFADQLDRNSIPHEWYLFTQGHSESYWSEHLEQYLLWYGKDW